MHISIDFQKNNDNKMKIEPLWSKLYRHIICYQVSENVHHGKTTPQKNFKKMFVKGSFINGPNLGNKYKPHQISICLEHSGPVHYFGTCE